MQCILEISLKKIKSNWKKINEHSNFKASAVVKANAYGFGLEEIAIALQPVSYTHLTLPTICSV